MAGTIAPFPLHQYLTNAGAVAASHRLFTYEAGTSTKVNTYTDSALSVAHSNPITLNSAGRPTSGIYLTPGVSYKFVLAPSGSDDPPSSPVWTQDNIEAVPAGATSADVDVSGTAGENLAQGEVCYLSDGSGGATTGRWYKADADQTYSSVYAQGIGFATSAITTGSSGSIRTLGRVTGLTGLTAGTLYYISATAGALTSTGPTNARVVARADSTTSVVIVPSVPDASATLSGAMSTGTQAIAGAKTLSGALTCSSVATFSAGTIGAPTYDRLTANVTKNNNTTLSDLTGLAFSVVANGVYSFAFYLYGISSSTADFKFTLTGPAAPTAIRFGVLNPAAASGATSAAAFGTARIAEGIGAAPSVDQALILHGLLRNGANAGTVQLQFAQNTAEVADSIIYAESHVLAWRIS